MSTRICFICPHIYGYFSSQEGYTGGGAERQIYLLSTALADKFDVHVVVGDYGQRKKEYRHGVTLHRAYPLHPRQHIFQPAKHLLLLGRAMQRADADVYIHRGSPKNAAFVYLLTAFLRRKWIYHIASDGNINQRPKRLSMPVRRLFTSGLQNADKVITQTAHQQKLLEDSRGVQSTVIPNGYPGVEGLQPYNSREFFLWVGSLNPEVKRPHLFLDCAENLPELQFRVVGPIAETKEYDTRIKERAAELDNVTLVGECPPDEIHRHYRQALALVNTSSFEGFPNTFLEAWRQGTPVVSLDIPLERFGIEDGMVANGDRELLQQYLEQLSTECDLWQTHSEKSISHFEDNFNIDMISNQYAEAIRSVL